MRTYEIRTKEGYFIGVDTMTPEQARKAEKDFIIKEAQPKRSKIGASAVGRSPGSDDGRPKNNKTKSHRTRQGSTLAPIKKERQHHCNIGAKVKTI